MITRPLVWAAVAVLLPFNTAFGQSTPTVDNVDELAWKPTVRASLRLLLLEHGTRLAFQEKTRREHQPSRSLRK